jgi:protein-tyrosine phosphatase
MLRRELNQFSAAVDSAGTHAEVGLPADATMTTLAQGLGLHDLAAHRSRPLLPSMLSSYDLVLCMERRHIDSAVRLSPTQIGKIKLLGHWGIGEISDPYRGTAEQYEVAVKSMQEACSTWVRKLVQLGMVR